MGGRAGGKTGLAGSSPPDQIGHEGASDIQTDAWGATGWK